MKRFIFSLLAPLAVFIMCCCDSDDLSGDSYYTFKGETVATYIENRPDSFSVFTQVVKDAGEESLLATYGHYTAFIPTNEAYAQPADVYQFVHIQRTLHIFLLYGQKI